MGNFALFGATGGKLFVQGGGGDRFGVRNTGALAVVEGVGEFACEYMVNGTVLLGEFGMGFGNGMRAVMRINTTLRVTWNNYIPKTV